MLRPRPRVSRPAAGIVMLSLAVAACSDDDTAEPVPEDTTPEIVVDSVAIPPEAIERPVGTVVVPDTGFVPGVLADDEVTPEELDDAYTRYLDCLADGGASGRYAYDIDLHVGLTIDWQIDGDGGLGRESNTLDVGCSTSYLGDIANRYYASASQPDDLQQRQHDSIAECVAAIDPAVADEIPDDITTDTSGGGVYLDEALVDLEFLGVDPDDAGEVSLCIARFGVPWQEFGSAGPTDDSARSSDSGSSETTSSSRPAASSTP